MTQTKGQYQWYYEKLGGITPLIKRRLLTKGNLVRREYEDFFQIFCFQAVIIFGPWFAKNVFFQIVNLSGCFQFEFTA